jgi:hypothetical protein
MNNKVTKTIQCHINEALDCLNKLAGVNGVVISVSYKDSCISGWTEFESYGDSMRLVGETIYHMCKERDEKFNDKASK